jgi:hypothetical protein
MTIAENEIACPTMTKPLRGQVSVLARGSMFLAWLRVLRQPSLRAEQECSRGYESCRWCDSTERQLNNAIMFGHPARF